jgi:tetratricopeptide (TPR) repeat protein
MAAARREYQRALKAVDRLTERQRLLFLAALYVTNGEHERALAVYEQLGAKWPHDAAIANDLALTYDAMGQRDKCIEAARRAVHLAPHSPGLRNNLLQDLMTADRFDEAVAESDQELVDFPQAPVHMLVLRTLVMTLAGHRDLARAALARAADPHKTTYRVVTADLALAEGRPREAIEALAPGGHTTSETTPYERVLLAQSHLRRGNVAAARSELHAVGLEADVAFYASQAKVEVGDVASARVSADRLAENLDVSARAMGKWLEGEILRAQGHPQAAMVKIQDGLKLSDLAVGHFMLARAALDAKLFAEAYGELQTCSSRLGELARAESNAIDETYYLVPQVTYYLAKAQEGLGSPEAKASYQAFLAMMHDPDPDDALVVDARKHVQ